jgi:hypothetical protein
MRLVLWRMQCGLVPSAAAGLMLGLEVLVRTWGSRGMFQHGDGSRSVEFGILGSFVDCRAVGKATPACTRTHTHTHTGGGAGSLLID